MPAIDAIVINARIVTMDPLMPRSQALAISAGRVVAIGTDDDIRALASAATRVVDAGGRLVLPGFQDTHIHLQDSGQDYSQNADLSECRSVDALVATLAGFARTIERPWVNGTGWYSGVFGPHNLTRHVLDRAVPDRPCLIVASDGHNACMNTLGLRAVGIEDNTPDPPNGQIVRDQSGVAAGLLYEDAIAWVEARMPPPSDAAFADGVRWATALANRNGITGVIDAKVEERHVRVYRDLAHRQQLTLRVASTALVRASDTTAQAVERLSDFRAQSAFGLFRVHSAKFFLDGVIENRTAAMIEPYSDALGGNAPVMFEPAQIDEMFTALDAARFQIHVHAIGDMATRAALDGMEVALKTNGGWPGLHQIAHIQFIDPADIPRFRALGVMANVQPLWARHEVSVDDLSVPVVGPERSKWIYAFRSLLDAGAQMALSSDWGVSTLNPFEIIETAITRQPPRKEASVLSFLPEQRMTIAQAVAGYTTQAAAAAWRQADTGSLGLGKFADLIVLDRDIFECSPYEVGDTRVLLTLLAGQEVHRAQGF